MRNAVRKAAMKRATHSRIAGKNGQSGRHGGKGIACPPRPRPGERPLAVLSTRAIPAEAQAQARQAKGRAQLAGISAGLALLAGLPARAMAASASLGDMSDSLKAEFAKFGPMLKAGFALAGFFLVGLGLWQLYALSQQPGRPKSGAIMAIVVGACLLACATIAQMTSGSLAAGDPELSSIGL